MTKKISIGAKPTQTPAVNAADSWVDNRSTKTTEREPMKRFTIDVPESLHRAVKLSCVGRGVKIADELREILAERYGRK